MRILKGFSIIEAMVVISILALLAALAIPSFEGSLARNKVRKTIDLISEIISMSQSEALRRNIKIYVSVLSSDLCIGSAPGQCDLRRDPLMSGINVAAPNLVLSPFYGVPSPAPATFTVSYSGLTQSVSINRMGIINIGVAP